MRWLSLENTGMMGKGGNSGINITKEVSSKNLGKVLMYFYAMVVQLLSCVQLFSHPMDCSLPGSSVHRLLQGRILDWIAIFFSRESSKPRGFITFIMEQILLLQWESPAADSLLLSHLGGPLLLCKYYIKLKTYNMQERPRYLLFTTHEF